MLSLKQITQKEFEHSQKKKIEYELPYFIAFVTLLATSGYGPYSILKKMKEINLLPTIRLESEKLLRRIDILGLDPLTALSQAKDRPSSKSLGEFLNGYVSAIQGGGNVINFLKNKMESIFERYSETQKQTIGKVTALVESYMMIQIVILAVYIIITAVGSAGTGNVSSSSGFDPQMMVLIFPPIISIMFIFLAHKMNNAKIQELPTRSIINFAAPCIAISVVLIILNILPNHNSFILVGGLIAASIWPAVKFRKIYEYEMNAASATPQILREIAEARKAGTGPEKCVIMACERKNYNLFNNVANSIANKLEWGIPLRNIFLWVEKEVKNFHVLISFKILFEIIASGGGNVHTLGTLAETSEKIHEIEKTKRDMLKPYLMIGFMLMGITGFTTLLVIDSLTHIGLQSEINDVKIAKLEAEAQQQFTLFSFSVIAQSWFAGLFLSKVATGTYSGGFQHSIILVIISLLGIIMIQNGIMDVNVLFNDGS